VAAGRVRQFVLQSCLIAVFALVMRVTVLMNIGVLREQARTTSLIRRHSPSRVARAQRNPLAEFERIRTPVDLWNYLSTSKLNNSLTSDAACTVRAPGPDFQI
jgi:hypothetical protein